MEIILSTTNRAVSFVRSLKDKKTRKQQGKFIVEGENIVKDIPQNVVVDSVFIAKSKINKFLGLAQSLCADVKVVDDKIFDTMCETITPNGILAVVQNSFIITKSDSTVAVLDGISDAGNFGTIIRTCVAVGITEIYALNCVDAYCGKVVRASMSGIFKVNIYNISHEEIQNIASNYRILALDMGGINLFEYTPAKGKFALAIGSEAHGLSAEVKALAAETLSLPMTKNIESLNASIAFSVAIYKLLN